MGKEESRAFQAQKRCSQFTDSLIHWVCLVLVTTDWSQVSQEEFMELIKWDRLSRMLVSILEQACSLKPCDTNYYKFHNLLYAPQSLVTIIMKDTI